MGNMPDGACREYLCGVCAGEGETIASWPSIYLFRKNEYGIVVKV